MVGALISKYRKKASSCYICNSVIMKNEDGCWV